jgi:hypothetical protein
MQSEEQTRAVYESIPGGAALLAWMGDIPAYHDGEIVSLLLHRRSSSFLQVTGYGRVEYGTDGIAQMIKNAVVTFELKGICYLDLNGFSQQNVIGSLIVSRRSKDPEVSSYYDFNATDDDFEITLEPCYGLDGLIRCNSIAISFKPGEPEDALEKRISK